MFILYDLIFLVFAIIYLPIYLLRRRFYRGFISRLGILPSNLKLDGPIWIHAVSVGEAMVVSKLIEELRKRYPEKKFVISTVTPTGNKIARNIAKEGDFITYLPLDISFIVKSAINKINPSIFVIAETEIWPNLISYLYKKNIPVAIINGRISNKSFKGYLLIRFLLKFILRKINLFCVQTSRDANRLMRLGAPEDKIHVTGNMKFDLDSSILRFDSSGLRLSDEEQLLVCGSTHPGEEEILLDVYKQLQIDFPNLKLLIAPRHPQRSKDIDKIISRYGLRGVFISALASRRCGEDSKSVFILDTLGQLMSFYAISDIVFVGGSLIKKGGHNILEPASLNKPILFGPHMFNFQDIAELFLNNKAAILVHNKQELKIRIKELLLNPTWTQQMSQRAKELIVQNSGSTNRNLQLLLPLINKE